MKLCNSQISNKIFAIKLIGILALLLFFCNVTYAQEGVKTGISEQQKALEKELMLLIETGVEGNLISKELRDSIMMFVKGTNSLSNSKFIIPQNNANKVVVMRDGIPIMVDTTLQKLNIKKEDLDLALDKKEIKNSINKSLLLPDKLPIPERASKNKYESTSQEALKAKMLQVDYFSKGLDGYYKKLIDMGYVGQGWVETKEAADAIARMKGSIVANLGAGYTDNTPGFIKRFTSSKNPFLKVLGGILGMLNNGANAQVRPGYSNPNYLITTPPAPTRRPNIPKRFE